jgi:hypothetical protein
MQGLKVLVAGMGALIVVSLGLLAWGFYSKLSTQGDIGAPVTGVPPQLPAGAAPGAAADAGAPPSAAGFGEVRVELPAGCTLAELRSEPGRLFVRTGPVGLCERVLVLDPATGTLLGTFVFRP